MANHIVIRKNPTSGQAPDIADALNVYHQGQMQLANQQSRNMNDLMRIQMMGRDVQNQERAFAQQAEQEQSRKALGEWLSQSGGLDNPNFMNEILPYMATNPNTAGSLVNMYNQNEQREYQRRQDSLANSRANKPQWREITDGYGGTHYVMQNADGSITPVDLSALQGQQMPTQGQGYTVQDMQNQILGTPKQPTEQDMVQAVNSLGANIPMQQPQAQSVQMGMPYVGGTLETRIDPTRLRITGQDEQIINGVPYYGNVGKFNGQQVFLPKGLMPQEPNAFQNEMQKQYANQAMGFNESGMTAQEKLSDIQKMQQILPDTYTGTGANAVLELQKALASTGMADKDIGATAQLFDSLVSGFVLDSLGEMKGVASDKDSEMVAKTAPSLNNTQGGNKLILEIMARTENRKIERAIMAEQYAMQKGTLAGFNEVWNNYIQQNSLLDGLNLEQSQNQQQYNADDWEDYGVLR